MRNDAVIQVETLTHVFDVELEGRVRVSVVESDRDGDFFEIIILQPCQFFLKNALSHDHSRPHGHEPFLKLPQALKLGEDG